VRYSTAAMMSVVLIGGMFAVPAVIMAVFLPSLKQGLPDPLPGYEQILLAAAAFCLSWRFVLALPIAVVLFTLAAFTGPRLRQQHGSIHSPDNRPMNRPVGITVIASLSIFGVLVLGVIEMLSPHRLEGGEAWVVVVVVILNMGLGVALLRLQNWARAILVVLYALWLITLLGHVIFAHSLADVFTALVPGSYALWAVWYMHQPHVKRAFGLHTH
jgi:hypothetical protein